MKKQITSALLSFATLFVLAVAASAQRPSRVAVQIPFDFVAGEKHLPAGRYVIGRLSDGSETTLLIQSEDGRGKAIVVTADSGVVPARAELKFRRHGDQYFLAQVSLSGTASVRELPESGAEKKLVRELAEQGKSGDAAGKVVAVAGGVQ